MNIAYYITGHGLGHATRSLLVLEYLLSRGFHVHVISSIKTSFFESYLRPSFDGSLSCWQRSLDSGAVQEHSLKVNALVTLRKYFSEIHENCEKVIDEEVAFLQLNNIDVCFVDATPIACAAAKKANSKCVLLTNFTWDVIYREMMEYSEVIHGCDEKEYIQLKEMVSKCGDDYASADAYCQLPGETDLPIDFGDEKKIDAPLLARSAKLSKEQTRLVYGIERNASTRVVLVGFGGHDTQWTLSNTSLPAGWVAWVLGAKETDLPPGGLFHPIPFDTFVPDLINAADVVLGKLGYGTVSECLTHGTPLVYVPRSSWPEEEPLKVYLQSFSGGLEMPIDDFVGGNWATYLHSALTLDMTYLAKDKGIDHTSKITVLTTGDGTSNDDKASELCSPVSDLLSDSKLIAMLGPKYATYFDEKCVPPYNK